MAQDNSIIQAAVGIGKQSAGLCMALFAIIAAILLLHRRKNKLELPVWLPLEIGLTKALIQCDNIWSYLPFIFRRHGGSLFGVTSRHQILFNLQNIEKLLSKGHGTFSTDPLGLTMLQRVFGATVSSSLCKNFAVFNAEMATVVGKGFVNEAAAMAAIRRGSIPDKINSLLSFSGNPQHQRRWEQNCHIRSIVPEDGRVTVNLEALLKDFGACISIPLLYGQDFLDRNPTLLKDFWKFDNDAFPLLIAGFPTWTPINSFKGGIMARGRLHNALAAFYHRVNQFQNHEVVDSGANMSDVSNVVLERNRVFEKYDISIRERGELELGLLWGQNANLQLILFWFIFFIYSTPGLLNTLRTEVANCVVLSTVKGSPHVDELNLQPLGRNCPILRSALLETFRMVNEPTSIRCVSKSLTVVDDTYQHVLDPGTWISVPHAGLQHDALVFPEPEKFLPERFVKVDKQTGHKVAQYGRLRPWGLGAGTCKGRTFAEQQLLAVAACFISVWDVESGEEKGWRLPQRYPGTDVLRPAAEVMTVVRRRLIH